VSRIDWRARAFVTMMFRSMPSRALALVAVLALPILPSAAAAETEGPSVRLTPRCYLSGEEGLLTGRGFRPDATWTARLGRDRRLGRGRTDGEGRIRARFTAPAYRGTAGTRELTLTVGDGERRAQATLRMTPLTASFSPRTGDPATMRVRWRVLGLTARRGVYVHYIRPNGTLRRTLRIGTARAPCGSLKTGPIALFPFDFSYGRWTFQVDASRAFSRETVPRLLIRFDIEKPAS
jgi:hypothetical protein